MIWVVSCMIISFSMKNLITHLPFPLQACPHFCQDFVLRDWRLPPVNWVRIDWHPASAPAMLPERINKVVFWTKIICNFFVTFFRTQNLDPLSRYWEIIKSFDSIISPIALLQVSPSNTTNNRITIDFNSLDDSGGQHHNIFWEG